MPIGKLHIACIHDPQRGDILQLLAFGALLGARQHIFRNINTGDAEVGPEIGQGQPCAGAEIKHTAPMRLIIQAINDFLDIFSTEKREGEIIMVRPASVRSAHIIGAQKCMNRHFISVYCSYSEI